MQPYPRSPDLVWPGHLHGSGCLSARAVGTGFPTVGLRLWLGPGCGWSWVLLTPASRGWGLGWVCLGSVCGVVPPLPAVCGVRGWSLVSASFRDLCNFVRGSLAPLPFPVPACGVGVVLGPGLGCAPPFLAGWWGCVFCAFFLFRLLGVPVPGLVVSPPFSFLSGRAAGLFFFFFLVCVCLFRCPFSRWAVVPGLVLPVLAGWSPCASLGVLSSVSSGWGFGHLLCCWRAVWWLWAVFARPPHPPPPFFFFFWGRGGGGLAVPPFAFPRLALALWLVWGVVCPSPDSCVLLPATPGWVSLPLVVGGPRHSWLGSAGGGGVWCVVCGGGVLVGLWLVCGVVGPSPLLAEVPVCYSPPLLAGFCCRGWWAVPATPGWGPLAAVVCGVWCVVCGGGVLVGSWLVCGVVGPSPLLAEVLVCYSPPLLAGFCCRGWWAVPATPGWGPLAAVVCGVWCVVCGGGVLVGSWLVCGVVGPSPLLAEVLVCYSPPLLAGFRCRWWWAVPATPGWGPLAAVVCGVWCVAVVWWWGPGWCVVWLVPRHSWRWSLCATPRNSWLGFAAGGGGRSRPLLAGVRWRRWCVVCGVWCVAVVCCWGCGWCVVWFVPRHSWRRSLCATRRHSWLRFAAGGGGRSPPLLAEVRWRRWFVVCGVWRWCVGGVVAGVWCGWSLATPGGGSCVLLPATPGWVLLPRVVGGPRHSWLGSAGGGGVWCVVCGEWRWCVGGVVAGVWCGWSLATPGGGPCVLLPATPGWVSLPVVVGGSRHSWLGSAGGGGVWCVVRGGGVVVGSWLVRGVVGSSPLLAVVPVCYSPPLLAGFRCRWWWAVPATPGWGPLAAVVCGVWCVVCGGGVLLGLWLVCGVVRPSPLLAEVPVCYSPPLLAGFRCRWWWAVPATPG